MKAVGSQPLKLYLPGSRAVGGRDEEVQSPTFGPEVKMSSEVSPACHPVPCWSAYYGSLIAAKVQPSTCLALVQTARTSTRDLESDGDAQSFEAHCAADDIHLSSDSMVSNGHRERGAAVDRLRSWISRDGMEANGTGKAGASDQVLAFTSADIDIDIDSTRLAWSEAFLHPPL